MKRAYGILSTNGRVFGTESVLDAGDVIVVTSLGTLHTVAGHYEQSDATVTPQLYYANGVWQELTNAACTGFLMPTDYVFRGQEFQVTNSTGNDPLATGDYAIPAGSTWTFKYNGSTWKITTIS